MYPGSWPRWQWLIEIYWKFFRLHQWFWAKRFQIRNGYDPRDCYDLGRAMAKWLVPRLRGLADRQGGAPTGYPRRDYFAPDFDPEETDFDLWYADLHKAADALAAWVRFEDEDGSPASDYMEQLKFHNGEVDKAMAWIALWFRSLWN